MLFQLHNDMSLPKRKEDLYYFLKIMRGTFFFSGVYRKNIEQKLINEKKELYLNSTATSDLHIRYSQMWPKI